jgi:diguanylate cyclase (GGDEF)-like protein
VRQTVPAASGNGLPSAVSTVGEIVDTRRRAASGAGRADRWSAATLGLGFLVLALACAVRARGLTPVDAAVAVPLIGLYVVAYRTVFESVSSSAVPTQPILVGLLLLLHPAIVPITVLLALQIAGSGVLQPHDRREAVLLRWVQGWHCLGPVCVLLMAGSPPASLDHWPLYLGALAAQFVLDATVCAIRARVLGVPLTRLAATLRWTYAIDCLLALIGVAIVLAGARSLATVLMLAAPIGLIHLLARDRVEQFETAVSLSTAYSEVQAEARVDPLTRLANRRAWEEAMDDAARRLADGTAVSVMVLMADLDGLKYVNDTFGHEAGDELIRSLAQALRAGLPQAAVTARLGGDEFGALLISQSGAILEAETLATLRAVLDRQPGVHGQKLSASLGVASCPPEPTVHEAGRMADHRAGIDKMERRANRSR